MRHCSHHLITLSPSRHCNHGEGPGGKDEVPKGRPGHQLRHQHGKVLVIRDRALAEPEERRGIIREEEKLILVSPSSPEQEVLLYPIDAGKGAAAFEVGKVPEVTKSQYSSKLEEQQLVPSPDEVG